MDHDASASREVQTLNLDKLTHWIAELCIAPGAGAKLHDGALPHSLLSPIVERVKALSEQYVAETRTGQSPSIDSESNAQAYAAYFLLINLHKFRRVLSELPLPSPRPLSVLDVGAGPGTASFALRSLVRGPIEVKSIEPNPHMRQIGQSLSRSLELPAGEWVTSLDEIRPNRTFDLVLIGNVLNEMSRDTGFNLLQRLMNNLAPNGLLVAIEPALKESTWNLMALRDRLIESIPSLVPLFPCTHAHACPMRRGDLENWCHGTLSWNRPPLIQQIDQLTGFNKHRTKFSSFACRIGGEPIGGYRALGEATTDRRGDSALVCGSEFYGTLLLPKRNRTDSNRIFKRARSLDRFSISPPPADGEITKDATVCQLVINPCIR